jgi:histidinol-phosphate aminotransferase
MVKEDWVFMKKTVLDLIPDHLRAMRAYVPGKSLRQAQGESGVAMIKMASNENPFGPSDLAVAAIRAAAAEVHLYPDNDATELRIALAERHQLAAEQIFVADGSLGVLDILARTLLAPGLNCITSERSFISYPIVTQATGAQLVTVPMKDGVYNLDGIARCINYQTRVIILANPNNPTGSMFDADATEAFLARVPDHVLVVLDEAYSDFAEYFAAQRRIIYSRAMDYVRAGRMNVLVLRTFSKAHGLAGLRVGYGCGHPGLLQYFARLRNSFSISVVAQAGALAALQDEAHIRRTIENNAAGAAWLMARLSDLRVRTIPTSANFIYVETEESADELSARVQSEGVIIRPLAPWGIPNGLRVTIGTPEQNERFIEALKSAMGQAMGAVTAKHRSDYS